MTPIACPCCRATNESGPNCRRCKADLGVLFLLMERREYLLEVAQDEALNSDFETALSSLDEADRLKPGLDIQRLRAAVHVLAGDFASAWTTYSAILPNPATRL